MPRIRIRTSRSWTLNEGQNGHANGAFVNDKGVNNGPGSVSTSQVPSSSSFPMAIDDASNWDKFMLLLWKNYKLQIRHKLQTFLEVTLPVVFTIIVVVIRCIIESKRVDGPMIYPPFKLDDVPDTPRFCCDEIYYAPNNSLVENLIARIQSDYFDKSDYTVTFRGFRTEDELVDTYFASLSSTLITSNSSSEFEGSHSNFSLFGMEEDENDPTASPILAGIIFTNEFLNGTDAFPQKIQYKLRFPATPRASSDLLEERFGIKKIWFTETLYPVVQLSGPRAKDQQTGGVPGYYDEGFLYLQYVIDTTLAKIVFNNDSLLDSYDIKLQRFPYPSFIDDKFLYLLQGVLPLTLILSFIFPVVNITKSVVVEKEKRLKEYMRMMRLPNWLHWTAWFVKSFLALAISCVFITFLLKIRVMESQILEVFPKSSPTLIYACLLTHVFHLIGFAFFMSTLFKTANAAAITAAIAWFLFFVPFAFLQPRYHIISRTGKMMWGLGTNIGICFCCQLFCMFEGTGLGAQWDSVFQGSTPNDPFCLADCMMIMMLNGFLYMIAAWYVEAVFPGEFGIPIPWYFPFTKWYWTGEIRNPVFLSEESEMDGKDARRKEFFENIATKSKPGIQIKRLTKKFGNTKVAVRNMSLNIFEDEIFVLLGHNGSGKTTTMSMLAGIYPPTSGTAIVNGFDICTDMNAVHLSLGLCPQSNILFSELTVEEHIRFYSILKGIGKKEVDAEVDRMVSAIGLQEKRDTPASALSGGMKRRLSVGIAFCAQSKVVLLDEPSSGLDPGARRSIWDLIQGEKKGRTILLSTHYMDEADVLGDRIGVMAEGEIQCCGTSLFLKKKYGCGYHLVIVKDPDCSVDRITEILKSKLEDVEQEQNVGAELSYALPDNQSHLFPQLFQELEDRKDELGIASYGASITTLEEVFMRVGQFLDTHDSNGCLINPNNNTQATSETELGPGGVKEQKSDTRLNVTFLNGTKMELRKNEEESEIKNKGSWLRVQQFWAMICKKVTFTKRKYGLLLGQIAICFIYPSLMLFVTTTIPGLYDPIAHPILLKDYEDFGSVSNLIHCDEDSPPCQGIHKFLNREGKKVLELPANDSVENYVLQMAENDTTYVNFKYFIGFDEQENETTGKTDLIGLFNNQPLHTPPLALNFITNAIFNSFKTNKSYEVEVTNHPFGYGPNLDELGSYFTVGFQVGLHFSLAMGFTVAIYSIFPIQERSIGSKHLQFVSGVNFILFWLANFLVDLMSYLLPCATIHLILIIFKVQDFYSVTVQLYILLLFYCYAFAVFPLMYLSSLYFTVPSSGLVGMGIFNVLTGYATLFVSNVLGNPELDKDELATSLHRIFMVVPTYSLGKGITQISLNYQVGQACEIQFLDVLCGGDNPPEPKSYLHWCCEKLKPNYLDWDELGIGKNLTYLAVFGIIFWTILLLLDSGLLHNLLERFKRKIADRFGLNRKSMEHHKSVVGEEEDVKIERKRIQTYSIEQLSETDNLIVSNLTKVFSNGTVAVDRMCLGIKKGECFGLLGANGAGKTCTFKMLTGDMSVTSGDAFIYKYCIHTDMKRAHRNMGYCPQFDSLIEEMTGRETLRMYARLRGIREKKIDEVITTLAEDLLFTEFLDIVARNYSGGNKRKLSTAIALIGNPPIVFLDEPTSGIDPMARRHLWECIARVRDKGTSVILTSHSMEETEFLCTRLAVMVNGRFRCLGSPQHLKSKYGEGYTLTAQITYNESAQEDIGDQNRKRRRLSSSGYSDINDPKLKALQNFIEASLPGCTLEDIHQGFLHYRVQDKQVTWAQMFTVMEMAKEKFNVQYYSVGQTSLEQLFINFTRAQNNADL